ncbi:MAG: hypothetical protein PHN88_09635 [Ignavibacteria bacterium]|nr:hypothetical protein [Ignavibacteria bacterium]
MKKIFLIILLVSASCLYSQGKKQDIDLRVRVSGIPQMRTLQVTILSPDSLNVFEHNEYEEIRYLQFTTNKWYKKPGSYKISVKIRDTYTLRSTKKELAFDVDGTECMIYVPIDFETGNGKKNYLSCSKYYCSSDSITLTENWTPKSKGYPEYIIQNNSQRNIYGDKFVDNIIGDIEKFDSGNWEPYFRGGGICGYYVFDVDLKPGCSNTTSESSFPIDLKPFEKGRYKYVVEYYTKDEKNARKHYRLEKEFEIKED